MIEEISGLPEATIGFRATGKVTGDDYDKVLTPAIDRAIEEHHRVKMLAVLGPDFEGYSLEAAWDDTRLGLRHWSGFERIAVATDSAPFRHGLRAMGFLLPCPIRIFGLADEDDARRWLEESLGTIHLKRSGDVLIVQLIGKLEVSAYEGVDDRINDEFSRAQHPRLLLDLRDFDGWSGLSALSQHFSLVREHRRKPERIAVVGDKSWQRLAEKVLSQFVNAKTHFFDSDDYEGAIAWVEKS